ncbi:MAG: coproporphyrinogen III oxidase [Kineosporiaceae bacterium]|nr:coproporphyrinogen III oxidase [Kineosporiaceae bacterium]
MSDPAGVHRPLGLYVHVPFCARRCGYCDFNTYTATELGGRSGLGNQDTYVDTAIGEIRLAATVLAREGQLRPASTVFFGGGTPTLLPVADLARMLYAVRDLVGLGSHAEVTTEANPDSVDDRSLAELAAAGFTRISFGMQSARPHVLAALDRTHDPARVAAVVRGARRAGLAVSLDLIYGADGESVDDWRASLDAATALAPEHLSAYALVVEDGTPLARRVARGDLSAPDEDDLAVKYELADDVLSRAGYGWYEVSNWARGEAGDLTHACRHNLGYWRGDDWWGIGPGAHSHLAGRRWWNVRHPRTYAARLAAGEQPVDGQEQLTAGQRHTERVLLGVRVAAGLPLAALGEVRPEVVAALVSDGLIEGAAAVRDRRVVLTRRGRLLADAVVRTLLA